MLSGRGFGVPHLPCDDGSPEGRPRANLLSGRASIPQPGDERTSSSDPAFLAIPHSEHTDVPIISSVESSAVGSAVDVVVDLAYFALARLLVKGGLKIPCREEFLKFCIDFPTDETARLEQCCRFSLFVGHARFEQSLEKKGGEEMAVDH